MDSNHNHTLGGGTFWRDGYQSMLQSMHSNLPEDEFITVEGGCDYLLDEVDGVLVDPWDKKNMVPAYPAIYAGRVQMFGTKTGTNTYNSPTFYAKLAQTFSFGIQPGRFTTYLMDDPNAQDLAKPYVKKLATMRYKLSKFMSFGEMLYPIEVKEESTLPIISSNWGTNNNPRMVTISALQRSVWDSKDSMVVVFANASMTETLDFSYDFNGSDYGYDGDLFIRQVTEIADGVTTSSPNIFTASVSLAPMDIQAFIIKPQTPVGAKEILTDKQIKIYPNPTTGKLWINSKGVSVNKIVIYNQLGQLVAKVKGQNQIDISSFPIGMYQVVVSTENGDFKAQIMLK